MWRGNNRKNKVRKDAKFDSKTARMVGHLLGFGFTYEDVGYVLGISAYTLNSWRNRYPIFKKEIEKAREAVKSITVAQLLRAAWGYDYEEVKEKWDVPVLPDGTYDEDNKKLKSREVLKKHQSPNPDLLKFILMNRDKENWQDAKRIDITSRNSHLSLIGEAEAQAIDELVGSLVKRIESKEVNESSEKDRQPKQISGDDSEAVEGEHSVSEESARTDS